jgi:putative membrane protein
MSLAASVSVAVVALLHAWFFVLESFLWTKPLGLRAFRQSTEKARATRVLAANQGVYNAFLAAGLAWSLCAGDPVRAFELRVFFLGCVIVAGVVGAVTASRGILWVQAMPAVVALVLVLAARG